MSGSPRRVAALDLGTNTFLALVAELDARGALRVVDDSYLTPRVGAGLASTGRIAPEAMERGLAALRQLADRVRAHGVDPRFVRAVGTAVFRRAANATEFVERARRECGVELRVIHGEEEGALSFAAAVDAAGGRDRDDRQVTPDSSLAIGVIDVGGGSTELAWDGGEQRVSASVGAVVLTERHLGADEDAAWPDEAWARATGEVERALAAALAGRSVIAGGVAPVVAMGGTAANLAALELVLERFEPARTEGARVTAVAARAWSERLRAVGAAERRVHAIETERAAILPAGLLCLAAAMSALGAETATATGRGLRYGLARRTLVEQAAG